MYVFLGGRTADSFQKHSYPLNISCFMLQHCTLHHILCYAQIMHLEFCNYKLVKLKKRDIWCTWCMTSFTYIRKLLCCAYQPPLLWYSCTVAVVIFQNVHGVRICLHNNMTYICVPHSLKDLTQRPSINIYPCFVEQCLNVFVVCFLFLLILFRCDLYFYLFNLAF